MRAMNEEKREYWLMCYPDQVDDAPEKGLGPRHFYAEAGDSGPIYSLSLMPNSKSAAGLLKFVGGRRFDGTRTIFAENGKRYEVPEYEQFDRATCVRVDADALVESGLAEIVEENDPFGAIKLVAKSPDLPASCLIEFVEHKLSDPTVPSFDAPPGA
jgi:hypothetical protein